MKTKLIFLALITMALASYGREAWMNINNSTTYWSKPQVVKIGEYDYFSDNHSDEKLNSGGIYHITNAPDCEAWNMVFDYENRKIFEILAEETNSVVSIDSETLTVANQFYGIMTVYFGAGAVTNLDVTEDVVLDFFASKVADYSITALQLSHATLLERYFAVLKESPYNPVKGVTWYFPFWQTEITVPQTRRYYMDDGQKIYLD